MAYDLKNGQFPYPLSYLPSDGGVVPETFVIGDDTLAIDGENWYVICLTPEQMIELQSIVAIGAPLVSEANYNTAIQKYAQLMQFPNQIPEDSCMDLCQLIIDCINDTPELQQLISQLSNKSGIDPETTEQSDILDRDFFAGNTGCDNDNIFGMTLQLADFFNQVAEDILEIFVTAFANAARLGDAIEAIPVVGSLPFDDILQFTEKMAEQINDGYQAAYDTQIREDIACELFCLAQENCELTMEQTRDYFQAKMTTAVTNSDFLTIANDIIANNWIGEQAIWVTHWLIADTIIFGGEILGIDIDRVMTTISTYFNDPNSDWSILCACAEDEFEEEILFYPTLDACINLLDGTQQSDGILSVNFANPLPGGSGTMDGVYVTVDIPDGTVLTGGVLTFDRPSSPSSSGLSGVIRQNTLATPTYASEVDYPTGTGLTINLPSGTYSNFGIYLRGGLTGAGNLKLKSFVLSGLKSENGGLNPFSGGLC